MGLSPSKRVHHTLSRSPDFNSACAYVFEEELALFQHALPGLKPYQLLSAVQRLHEILTVPLIQKWAPSPPTRLQVDRAINALRSGSGPEGEHMVLGWWEFKEFAVEVYLDVVVSNARDMVLKRVSIGAAKIAAVGMMVRPGSKVVGAAIGGYALGVAAAVYLSLNN